MVISIYQTYVLCKIGLISNQGILNQQRRHNQNKKAFLGCVTAAYLTLHVLVATTTYQYQLRVGVPVNKTEQVSSDDHQISVVGVGWVSQVPCARVGTHPPFPLWNTHPLVHPILDIHTPPLWNTHPPGIHNPWT